jgi:predicted O-methyltransferase YrrM
MNLRKLAKSVARRTPIVGKELDRVERVMRDLWVPPGHFYSPIPSREELRARSDQLFARPARELPAIDLNEAGQLARLEALKPIIAEHPFGIAPNGSFRYGMHNEYFAYSDGLLAYAMIRHIAPKRIVEVGCGYSSCLILDTNDRHFGGGIRCTFVDPDPERLLSLVRGDDIARLDLRRTTFQDLDLLVLRELDAGDVLFIDSTHVSKTGSDVNRLFFEALPVLAPGVHIHIHDVSYPFEYPPEWVFEGRAWNEAYILRAFLEYNEAYEIELFADYLRRVHTDALDAAIPAGQNKPGSSIWIRKR